MRKYQYWLSLAALVLYNNWLLGIIINPHATLVGATISELSIAGQPGALLFRSLDVLSGILFLLGAGAIISFASVRKLRLILVLGVSTLGISTIIESFLSLDCSSALDAKCLQHERLGAVSWQHNFHIVESLFTYGLMFLLPLAIYLVLRRGTQAYRLKRSSFWLMVFMVIWCAEGAIRFSQNAGSYGYEQRLFVLLFSLWYWQVIRQDSSRAG